MADSKKMGITAICSIVGCIVTLLTCGVLIGNIQGKQSAMASDVERLESSDEKKGTAIQDIKTKQAFLEGVVSTKLDVLYTMVSEIKTQVNEYESKPDGKTD